MKLCYVYQDQYPWDVRVEKITGSLADNGIETHIVSRNRDGLRTFEHHGESLYIDRLPAFENRSIRNLCNFPAFFSPFWIYKTLSVVKEHDIDLIIVRDLPLALTALLVGRSTNVPVMMDMAENYPAMISDTWEYRGPKPVDYLVRNPWLLRKLERVVLPRLDALLVVSEQSANRVKRMGVQEDAVFVVGNTPRVDHGADLDGELVGRYRKLSSYTILYVGGLEESRGLKTVLRALPEVLKAVPDALLCIVGEGTSSTPLKELAKTLGISAHVHFAGWKEHREVPAIIAASDVCIVPHHVTEHTDTTVPNKIFDYMAREKPVVATNARSLVEIVESTGCGRIYHDQDVGELAAILVALHDPSVREEYGAKGSRAVKETYNWKVDEAVLLSAVRSFARKGERLCPE